MGGGGEAQAIQIINLLNCCTSEKTVFNRQRLYTQKSHRVSSHPQVLAHHNRNSLFVNQWSLKILLTSHSKAVIIIGRWSLSKIYQCLPHKNHILIDSRLVALTNASMCNSISRGSGEQSKTYKSKRNRHVSTWKGINQWWTY